MKNLSGKANYEGLFDRKESKNEIVEPPVKTEIDGNELLHNISLLNLLIENVEELYRKTSKKDLGDALISLKAARNSLINVE